VSFIFFIFDGVYVLTANAAGLMADNTEARKINYTKKRGRCQEFSILYVATCLANNYRSKIVVGITYKDR